MDDETRPASLEIVWKPSRVEPMHCWGGTIGKGPQREPTGPVFRYRRPNLQNILARTARQS